MQRKFEGKTRGELLFEHVVWNAAAGAALSVMVLILLCSLQWMDQLSGPVLAEPEARPQLARPVIEVEDPNTEVAALTGPSG